MTELHAPAAAVAAARLAWHTAWERYGWHSPQEQRAYDAYQEAIAALGAALVNEPMKKERTA